jgi:hypothetical protein
VALVKVGRYELLVLSSGDGIVVGNLFGIYFYATYADLTEEVELSLTGTLDK